MALEPSRPGGARRAVVVGGGLAGISAAVHLADAGFEVTLFERRPYLGGKAYSFTDPETGQQLDNGQHVIIKCCTEYLALLRKLGSAGKLHLQPRLHVPVIRSGRGTSSAIYRVNLPPPLHLVPSLLRYRYLSPLDKLKAARVVFEMLRFPAEERSKLDGQTFAEWLRARSQSEASIRYLWNLICLPTINLDASRASAAMAMMVYQEGFLRSREAADIGWSRVGLSELVEGEAPAYLEAREGRVCTGVTVRSIVERDGRAAGVELAGGGFQEADVVVVAVQHTRLAGLLPDSVASSPQVQAASRLGISPIVSLHLWYDRPLTDLPLAAVVDGGVQWIFNRSRIEGKEGPGQHLALPLSGADEVVDATKEGLRERFRSHMRQALPAARSARLEKFVVVREAEATFAAVPGSWSLRPPAVTPLSNLFLAGAYTDTGWPATMEGAVRSGRLCAELAERCWRSPEAILQK